MKTRQPKWKYVGAFGDVDPIAHGGGFVYEDRTGVYPPEFVYFEPGSDESWHKHRGNTPVLEFRVIIESDPESEWWYTKLPDVARTCGQSLEDYQRFAHGTTLERAFLYEGLISYFGAEEFDSYPRERTEGKAYFRYWREMRRNLNGGAR
jgi:hypothetical protein